jgi:hypothetical protein
MGSGNQSPAIKATTFLSPGEYLISLPSALHSEMETGVRQYMSYLPWPQSPSRSWRIQGRHTETRSANNIRVDGRPNQTRNGVSLC